MVAARYAYGTGRTLLKRVSAVFAVVFGLFALLFTTAPKSWGLQGSHLSLFEALSAQNVAHADIPHTPDSGDSTGDSGCAAGDCGSDCGCGP
jgi:hypothetical protein